MNDDLVPGKVLGLDRRLRRLRPYWLALLAAAFVSVALLAAACGAGSSSSPGVASAGGTTTIAPSRMALAVEYSQCMRSHGVTNFPDPSTAGPGAKDGLDPNSPTFQAAVKACQQYAQPGDTQDTLTAQEQQDYLKAAACMRSHGFRNFPDPTFSDGNVNFNIPSSIDTHSAQYAQAAQICTRLIPGGLPYSGTNSGQSGESTTESSGS